MRWPHGGECSRVEGNPQATDTPIPVTSCSHLRWSRYTQEAGPQARPVSREPVTAPSVVCSPVPVAD